MGLGRQFIALAGIGSIGALTKQVVDFGVATVKAASDAEQAIVSLQTALQTTGRNIPVGGIQEWAAELQKSTRFEDEAIIKTFTLLTQLTALDEKGLKAATKGAIGLATVLDKDLNAATLQVARAMTGNAEALKRVGIAIDPTLSKQEQQRQVLERLQPLFARAEADSRTYAGATAQLGNAVNDLQEEIGAPFVQALTGASRAMGEIVAASIEWAKANKDLLALLPALVAAIGVGVGAAGLAGAIALVVTHIGLLTAAITTLITNPVGLAAMLALVGVGAAAFLLLKGRISEFTETLSKAGAEAGLQRMNDELDRLVETREALKKGKGSEGAGWAGPDIDRQIEQTTQKIQERLDLLVKLEAQEGAPGKPPPEFDKEAIQLAKKRAEAEAEALAKIQIAQAKAALAAAELARAHGDVTVDVAAAAAALREAESAAESLAARHSKTLTPAVRDLIAINAEAKKSTFETAEAERLRKEKLDLLRREIDSVANSEKDLAAVYEGTKANNAERKQLDLEEIQTKKTLLELEADRLEMLGQSTQADRLRLEARIQELQRLKAEQRDTFDTRVIDAQILNAQTALTKLGEVTLNVSQIITRGVGDMFEGVIFGTAKLADVGKAFLQSLGRSILQFFTESIAKKLGFENLIFSNVRGFVPALGNLFGGAGGGGGATSGPLLQSGGFFSGGGGGGTGIAGNITSAGGLLSKFLGFLNTPFALGGGLPAGQIGPLLQSGAFFSGAQTSLLGLAGSGLGGFGIGSLLGGLIGGKGSQGSLIGGGLGALGSIGTSLLLASSLGPIITSTVVSMVAAAATAMGATAATGAALGQASLPWLPGIGALIGAIIGGLISLFTKQEPGAIARAVFTGVRFNELAAAFDPGTLSVEIKKATGGISKSKLQNIQTQVGTVLAEQLVEWTNILNLFPDIVQKEMIPVLEDTNARLNASFGRLKFSEGGSRNIKEELAAFAGTETRARFVDIFMPIFLTGIDTALQQAGINIHEKLVQTSFPKLPTDMGEFDKFIESLSEFAILTGELSQQPLGKFLTKEDMAALTRGFGDLASITDPAKFIEAFEQLKEGVKPFIEFLGQAMQQTADILGRGIMAALEAASESDAQLAFFNSLNQGIKDAVFNGMRDSIIATAEFTDLFAPLQQAIRESIQSSLAGGQFDRDAFVKNVYPAIEAIITRGETLRELVGFLNEFGKTITARLFPQPEGLIDVKREDIATGLTESATLFGQGLIAAMEAASRSEALDNFMQTMNEGIKNAVFSGLVETFLAAGLVDDLLKPIKDAFAAAIKESKETGIFVPPDLQVLIKGAKDAAGTWEPLITFMQQIAFGIKDTLGLLPTPTPTNMTNIVINLNGTGNVDQGSVTDLARRINYMLEPQLAPKA